ncbi:MAG: hypothetical protein IJL99_05190 [Firmicutes bacterium]|nr:hypothetical protein [Bacillota bacterium]
MSATINIYDGAFSSKYKTVIVGNGFKVSKCAKLDWQDCLVFVNGNEVDENYRLRDGDVATVRQFPSGGGGGGWNGIDTILTVATGGLYGIANGINIAFGGTSWGQQIAQSIFSMPDFSGSSSSAASEAESIPIISGAKNRSAADKPIPFVIGTSYYAPSYIGQPYTMIDPSDGTDGENQYFTALFMLGQRDIEVKDVQLGIYGISTNPDNIRNGKMRIDGDGSNIRYASDKYFPEIEIQQDASEVSLYPQKVVQESFNTELLNPDGSRPLMVLPFSARYPQKVRIEVQFGSLLHYKDDGGKEDTSVTIGIAASFDGGKTYGPFGYFQKSSGDISFRTYTESFNKSGYSGLASFTKFTGCKNKVMRFCAEGTFSWNNIKDCTNNTVEFLVWRDNMEETDSKYQDKAYVTSITTWCYDHELSEKAQELVPQRPIIEKYRNMTARMGFRIKAGDEIQGTIDEVNCIVSSKARTCTVTNAGGEKRYSWSTATSKTNNPASLALLALQSELRGDYAYPDSMIDLDSFGEFYERCDEYDPRLYMPSMPDVMNGRRYVCNGVISKQMKTSTLVKEIIGAGHGTLTLNGTKYGIFTDTYKSNPVMVLNNQNVISASNTKAFSEDIDGYQAKFLNSVNYYQQDTAVCVDNNALATKDKDEYKLESINISWITDPYRVFRYCMYKLACRRLRPETWNRRIGIEGNLVEVGSLVEVQDDTLSVGLGDGAEIISITVDGDYIRELHTDGQFSVADPSAEYGIRITQANGFSDPKVATYKIRLEKLGVISDFVLDEPIYIDNPVVPSVGDIVSFGLFRRETAEALCFGKKDNGDGTFDLTLMPYQEGVYQAEEGDIPDFVSNVTPPVGSGAEIAAENVTLSDVQEIVNNAASGIYPSKYTLDISPEYQVVPVNTDGKKSLEWVHITATLYYMDNDISEDTVFTAEVDGAEVGFWDGNTVKISTSYLRGDVMTVRIKALYDGYTRFANATVAKLYAGEDGMIRFYHMLFPDGEKIKVDAARQNYDPEHIRVLKRVDTESGEFATDYGYITTEFVPDADGRGEEEYEQYRKVGEEEVFDPQKKYYARYKPFLLSLGGELVLGEDSAALIFYSRDMEE